MTSAPSPDAPTEPSKEALAAAREIRAAIRALPMDGGSAFLPSGTVETVALALDRFRAAGVREALQRAAASICFGCEHGWEVGEVHGTGNGYPYPIHKDPQTGNYGHPCNAKAIRALLEKPHD